jgi:hypothetical protein
MVLAGSEILALVEEKGLPEESWEINMPEGNSLSILKRRCGIMNCWMILRGKIGYIKLAVIL